MAGRNFVFVHWILPASLIAAGIVAYVYFDRRDAALAAFREDPRIEAALACSVEDMWVHQADTERVSEMGEMLDPDGGPPGDVAAAAEEQRAEAALLQPTLPRRRGALDQATPSENAPLPARAVVRGRARW